MEFILPKTGSHAVEEISGNQVGRSLSSPAVHTVAVSPIGVKPSSHRIVCVLLIGKYVAEFVKYPFSGAVTFLQAGAKTF